MIHSKLLNNVIKCFIKIQKYHDFNWFKTKLRNIHWIVESFKIFWKKLKNCSKITKKSLFFLLFGKKTFLNRTLCLRKSLLNQTTYVLKKSVAPTIFLKSRFFLKSGFLKSRFYCTYLNPFRYIVICIVLLTYILEMCTAITSWPSLLLKWFIVSTKIFINKPKIY